jgi:hypothetical protein
MTPRVVQLDPPLPLFDSARAPRGVPTDAVTDVVPDEARLCATWFGKAMCGLYAWRSARAFLPPPTFDALWGEPAREWAGGPALRAQRGRRLVAAVAPRLSGTALNGRRIGGRRMGGSRLGGTPAQAGLATASRTRGTTSCWRKASASR